MLLVPGYQENEHTSFSNLWYFDGNFEFGIKFGDCFKLPSEQEEWYNKIPANVELRGEQIKYTFIPQ